jgi:hypothetical protein
MFGLIVAELAVKLADALDSNHERRIGILTPALAFLLLTDVTAFWLYIWGERRSRREYLGGFDLLPNSHFGTAIGLSPGIRTAPHH